MKVGRLPCQEEALREAIAAKQRTGGRYGFSRRGWMFVVGSAMCSGAVGYWVRSAEDAEKESVDPRILWARRMASDETPIEELLANADALVLELMARSYDDPLVWAGIERICIALNEDSGVLQGEVRLRVVKYIAITIRAAFPPAELAIERFLPLLDSLSK